MSLSLTLLPTLYSLAIPSYFSTSVYPFKLVFLLYFIYLYPLYPFIFQSACSSSLFLTLSPTLNSSTTLQSISIPLLWFFPAPFPVYTNSFGFKIFFFKYLDCSRDRGKINLTVLLSTYPHLFFSIQYLSTLIIFNVYLLLIHVYTFLLLIHIYRFLPLPVLKLSTLIHSYLFWNINYFYPFEFQFFHPSTSSSYPRLSFFIHFSIFLFLFMSY